ncbi:MAG: hypothetical protein ACM3X4_01250 [Ignavibacteriales bacterium]
MTLPDSYCENKQLVAALRLWGYGLAVVPGEPGTGRLLVKEPEVERLRTSRPTEQDIQSWWSTWPDASILLLTMTGAIELNDDLLGKRQTGEMVLLRLAILVLAKGCDGAQARDGAGFNKNDADVGHALAGKVRKGQEFDERDLRTALKLAKRYRKQLKANGIDSGLIERLGDDKGKDSQADLLASMGRTAELWCTPENEAFATVMVGNHRENLALRGSAFKNWLVRRYFEAEGKVPASQAVQSALDVLEGEAVFIGEKHPVFVRVARYRERVYLDLADDEWRAIEIDADGWRIVENPPVRFRRAVGMLPLPDPVDGGSPELLREYVNVPDDASFLLLVSWIVGALNPAGPYPILVLQAEQGTGKSFAARIIRSLIDPNVTWHRAPPQKIQDLMISARNGWIVSFDNLSGLPNRLSDALCRLATGGGFSTRQLYTDADEVLVQVQRPIILNGIDDIASRPDLRDRAIVLTLPSIADTKRRAESRLLADFGRDHPALLGAFCNAVVFALCYLERVNLLRHPRMADFARWVVAAEPALPWAHGEFLKAYEANRQESAEVGVADDPLAQEVIRLAQTGGWTGTATELVDSLSLMDEWNTSTSRSLPRSPQAMGDALRRLAPDLRRLGTSIKFSRQAHKRLISIGLVAQDTVTAVTASPSDKIPC